MGEEAGELLLVADDEGRFVEVNQRVLDILGYTRDEMLGMSIWDLTPGANVIDGLELWQQFIREGQQEGEYVLRAKGGRLVRFAYRATADARSGRHASRLRELGEPGSTRP